MKKYRYIIILLVSMLMLIIAVVLFSNQPQQEIDSSSVNSQTSNMYANMKGDDFDEAYLIDMIAHHQGALNMASEALELASKQEIRTLSEDIVTSQSSEVQQMMDWQKEWYYSVAEKNNPHAGHAMESSGSMSGDMGEMEAKLDGLTGEAYDKEFLIQMILHHQQAIDMSKYADENAKHQEVKDLAKAVVSAQEKEIVKMKNWQQMWGY